MKQKLANIGVVQNLGVYDRILRFCIGCLMMAVPLYLIEVNSAALWYTNYLMLFSVYPFLTAILGIDPIYSLFKVKSCGTSNRNQCGTFPYEVDAALGHDPIPDSEIEHDLQHSHHAAHHS